MLDHAILHINLAFLVSREGCIETREVTICLHRFQFLTVVIVGGSTALAKEEPVESRRAYRTALMQEPAKRRDAGAGADHDDRSRWIFGQPKLFVGLNVDGQMI